MANVSAPQNHRDLPTSACISAKQLHSTAQLPYMRKLGRCQRKRGRDGRRLILLQWRTSIES